MSIDKFKFISPGIFVNEIDNTGRTAIPEDVGPVIIGRAEKGPILFPTRVNSYFDFVTMFGNPIPGGIGGDVARNGNYSSPTYGAYAAQAWFRNNSPATYVRLGGQAKEMASGEGLAGWRTNNLTASKAGAATNGGAYGLFVANLPSADSFGSGTIGLDIDSGGDTFATGDKIVVSLNGATFVTITASIADDIPMDGSTFSALGFGTGSSDAQCAKNISGSLKLALTGAGHGNGEWQASAAVDVVTIAPLTVTASTLPSVTLLVSESNASTGIPRAMQLSASAAGLGKDDDEPLVGVDNDTASADLIVPNSVTGTLAAIWYINENAVIGLSGTRCIDGETGVGSSIYFNSVGANQFKVQIKNSDSDILVDSSFNFSDTSDQFIRKIFNTNPILTNDNVTSEDSNSFTRYWLGESYEGSVKETLSGDNHIGVILPLNSGSTIHGGDFTSDSDRLGWQDAQTGFFFGQDLNTGESATGSFVVESQQKLFRLVARNSGDWIARNLKVSIMDLRASPNTTTDSYGSFSVVLREMSDTDNRVKIVEQHNNCNLNPNSKNFILRRIGDRHYEWDETDRRYRSLGDYSNKSAYIWVDMPEEVRSGDTDTSYLPWGVDGPLRFISFTDVTSSGAPGTSEGQKNTIVSGNLDDYGTNITTFIEGAASTNGKVLYEFPALRLRGSGSEGDPVDPLNSFYGVDTTFNTSRLDPSVRDYLKVKPTTISDFTTESITEVSYRFTLDDMCMSGAVSNKVFCYKADSRIVTTPTGGARGGLNYLRGTGSYKEVLDAGVDRYTTVFFGGTDGLDVKESEPLRFVNDSTKSPFTTLNNYVFNSVQVALDSIRDPEVVEYNLAAMPGVTNTTLNMALIDLCESRGDALAVVDLAGGYTPQYESTLTEAQRRGSVAATVSEVTTELITNSSYGAAYYPWVQIRDLNSGQVVWVPPSVAAIGAMSFSEKTSALWFAPAGFTRGGLSSGVAGLPVVGVRDRLTSRDRDKLYENKVNPIAQFPAEGIVIFGQKTLQSSASALDRINVRRLMVFLKRQISRFAATILFDQNVQTTWNRFKGQVEPFLRGVQAGLGITQFKLVLDNTTTTPDLVDRNIVYAKIYLKPARSIEYIAIDFILTDSGAAFED